jgi:hypothetical protein
VLTQARGQRRQQFVTELAAAMDSRLRAASSFDVGGGLAW